MEKEFNTENFDEGLTQVAPKEEIVQEETEDKKETLKRKWKYQTIQKQKK